ARLFHLSRCIHKLYKDVYLGIGMVRAIYVPYGEFTNYIASQVNLPKGNSDRIKSIKRASWYADDVDKKDEINTQFINGERILKQQKRISLLLSSCIKNGKGKAEKDNKNPLWN
ncbi:MAG: hypothetical protein KAT43_05525, partial [Nanoarchaeota archaeon]|nr:hypothetical protein [Nanoarchaeota archaeon]